MSFAAGATTGSRTLPHCAATSPLYLDVRYTPEGGHSQSPTACRKRAMNGLMRRNKKRLHYRPSIINIRDIFGGY